MSESNETTHLKKWYENFLKLFREESSKLSEEQRKHILCFNDYHSPCQIEVFWLKQPEWQLIVMTHFENRLDDEITINGPYDSRIFPDEMKNILNLPRWNILVENENMHSSDSPEYYSHLLAKELHVFMKMAKNAMFSEWESVKGMNTSFTLNHHTITHFFGNMGDYDYRTLISNMISKANEQIEASKKMPPVRRTPDSKIKNPKGFAAYFFPPIIIGKNSKRTVNEILDGIKSTYISPFDEKVFDITIDGVLVLLKKDGFVNTYTDNKTTSLQILNVLMMISILDGLDAHVVREHELCEMEYSPETNNEVSRSWDSDQLRNKMFNGVPDQILEYKTRHVDEERMKKIFKKTSEMFLDKDLCDDLVILLDAMTHIKDSEFFQAFIMGWKIIEKYISQQWCKKQDGKNKKTKYVAVDTMINDLKDELQEYFSDFSKLRRLRNLSIHDKKIITHDEAQKCVKISKELVLEKMN